MVALVSVRRGGRLYHLFPIIQLEAGTYTLTSLDNGINLLPLIIGNITIEGTGSGATVIRSIRAAGPLQTFNVDFLGTLKLTGLSIMEAGTGVHNLGKTTLEKVTISHNRGIGIGIVNNGSGTITIRDSTIADYTGAAGRGGGIVNAGNMSLISSTIKGNRTDGFGGIFNSNTGIMTIKTSTIADNIANDAGPGGILNRGFMELHNTLIQNNFGGTVGGIEHRSNASMLIAMCVVTGNENGPGASGGGIFNAGPMTISKSVVVFNKAQDDGGGIFNLGADLSIEDSVIFGNEAENPGGGIKNVDSGLLTLTKTVITYNTPDDCVGCP